MGYRDSVKNYKGIKGVFCKLIEYLLSPLINYYDALSEETIKRLFCDEENLRKLNAQLEGYSKVVENLRNNNIEIQQIKDKQEIQSIKQKVLERKVTEGLNITADVSLTSQLPNAQIQTDVYKGIDYFDFENYFRGSQEEIKARQNGYIEFFKGHSNIVDIGCGRGEFLELLRENELDAYGVDIYEEFVELCIAKGLQAIRLDALEALEKATALGGIFAGQLVEHLTIKQIVKLCELAYEKLQEGSCIVMETPNPTALSIYTHAFYIDPSHNKPVHPLTLKYILEKAGFKEIKIMYVKGSELETRIPELNISGVNELEEFNNAMQQVQNTLFGCQDYAIIAQR